MSRIRQRQLASTTKVPINVSPAGLLYVVSKVGSASHSLLLDTSFPGVLYKCESEGACPKKCTFPGGILIMYPNGGFACVDKVTADLQLGGGALSVPSFTVGRIPLEHTNFFDDAAVKTVDGVLGVGLPEFPGDLKDIKALDGNLPSSWSSYSIYVGKDTDAFLSVGGVDDGPISANGLTGYKYTAIKDEGYKLDISDFIMDGASAKTVSCKRESDCIAVINSASPLLILSETAWDDFEEYIKDNTYGCSLERVFETLVYVCSDNTNDKLPEIGFTIGDQTFFLTKEHYTVPHPTRAGKLAVMIYYDVTNDEQFTLGAPFFRAFYTAFDTPSRTLTFHCKDDVSCKTNYVPLPEPVHKESATATKTPSPTSDSSEPWYTPSYTPTSTYDPTSDDFYTTKYEEVEVDTTSDEIAAVHKTGYIFGVAGLVIIVLVAIFAQLRKRKVAKAAGAAVLVAHEFEELSTPQASKGGDHQLIVAEPIA